MNSEQLIIEKWRELNSEEQEQVLAFINSLGKKQSTSSAKSSALGKKLREIRAQIVASGEPLLSRDEIDQELAERRGGVYGWDE